MSFSSLDSLDFDPLNPLDLLMSDEFLSRVYLKPSCDLITDHLLYEYFLVIETIRKFMPCRTHIKDSELTHNDKVSRIFLLKLEEFRDFYVPLITKYINLDQLEQHEEIAEAILRRHRSYMEDNSKKFVNKEEKKLLTLNEYLTLRRFRNQLFSIQKDLTD